MSTPITQEEIERMRQIVKQHDSERTPMTIHDLNNPPKQPYRYQKFPMMVYDAQRSHPGHVVSRIVDDEDALEVARLEGWSVAPPACTEERIEPLSASYRAEAEKIDNQIQESKRRTRRGSEVA